MFWFILFLILLVVIFMVIKAGKNKNSLAKNVASVSQKRYVERDEKLMEAAANGHKNIVKLLRQYGAKE